MPEAMNDPTRFELDDRQRAMLAEMGVRVWAPAVLEAVPEAASAPAPAPSPKKTAAPASPPTSPVSDAPHPSLPAGLAKMDWAGLQTAAATCQACGLCAQRQYSVIGTGSLQAHWLVLGDAPGDAENASGQAFAGDAGRLLDNMLTAVGVSRTGEGAQGAYLMHATQCATPDTRNPTTEELSRCAAYVSRKVALLQPRVILVMGRFAMQTVLQSNEPLGKMRGQVHQYQGVPVVVTYPPAYLLRNTSDKGKAWADLCLALQVVQGSS
jgi:DNA polymerase